MEVKKIKIHSIVNVITNSSTVIYTYQNSVVGANFYPYLLQGGHNVKVSLYEPEIMSKFLDLSNMSLHKSSFNLNKL